MKAAIYARVSTGKQVKGYSLDQQIEALEQHAAREGHVVVGRYRDPGFSGAYLERPGMEALRDAIELGGIDVVFAQDADRITRDPAHRMFLDEEFKKYGTRLEALDDWGDDSHEGELLKFMKGWVGKGERIKITERSRRNKARKARQGMVVGGHRRAYGFDWVHNAEGRRMGYEVNGVEMQTVRRIFSAIASGTGQRTLKDVLDEEDVPTPGKGRAWSRPFIKSLILDDLYKAHTVSELRELGVSENVLDELDESNAYGVYRYADIPVPVPDAGIPLEIVSKARWRVSNNRSPAKGAGRFWELSGGLLRCSECDRAMQVRSINYKDLNKPTYNYYRCQCRWGGKADKCPMTASIPAEKLEAAVWNAIAPMLKNPQFLLDKMHAYFEGRRKELRGPGVDSEKLVSRRTKLEATWAKYQRAYEADAISIADLKARRAEIDAEREQIDKALERSRNVETELLEIDEAESEFEERILSSDGSLQDTLPGEERRKLYQDFMLKVWVGADAVPRISGILPARFGDISGTLWKTPEGRGYFIEPPVSTKKTSSRSTTPT